MAEQQGISLMELSLQSSARLKVIEQVLITMLVNQPKLAENIFETLNAHPETGITPDDVHYAAIREHFIDQVKRHL